jgi:hypothetical protein
MTRPQQNTHDMHLALLRLFEAREAVWTTKKAAVDAVTAFRGPVDQTTEIERERNALATEGLTDEKAGARDAMEAAVMRLVLAARPYARVSDDRALLAEVDVTTNRLGRLSDAAALGRAERVLAAVEPRLADLADYDVTKADVEALREAIEAFRPTGPVRDATEGQREARTALLPGTFRAARRARKVLDDVVEGVIRDPEFTAEYRRVRRTDDR